MPRLILMLILGLAVSGCGRLPSLPGSGLFVRDRPASALPYRATLIAEDGSDRFQVAVEDGGAPLAATRESVRFPATRHCLRRTGSSHAEWVAVPGTPEAWQAMRDGQGRSIYSGRCTGR